MELQKFSQPKYITTILSKIFLEAVLHIRNIKQSFTNIKQLPTNYQNTRITEMPIKYITLPIN